MIICALCTFSQLIFRIFCEVSPIDMSISEKTKAKLSEVKKSDQGDGARIWKKEFNVLCLKMFKCRLNSLNLDKIYPPKIGWVYTSVLKQIKQLVQFEIYKRNLCRRNDKCVLI